MHWCIVRRSWLALNLLYVLFPNKKMKKQNKTLAIYKYKIIEPLNARKIKKFLIQSKSVAIVERLR